MSANTIDRRSRKWRLSEVSGKEKIVYLTTLKINTMKKTLFFTMAVSLLAACSPKEKTAEDWNKIYLENGQKYVDVKFKEEEGEDSELKSVLLNKVDSINIISTRLVEYSKMTKLSNELTSEYELAKSLDDIDKSFTGERSDQTQYQVNKVKELQDSLNRWIARADKMNDKDTLFKEVYFSVDVTKKDGSKIKNKPFRIYFDLDGDVSAEMMDRAMGK